MKQNLNSVIYHSVVWTAQIYYYLQNLRQVGEPAIRQHTPSSLGVPFEFTDLNSPGESVDIRRDPSFPFYLRPAAIFRIYSVLAPLFHWLSQRGGQTNKSAVKWSRVLTLCNLKCPPTQTLPYHQSSVADVPGERGHGPFLRVHNGVLDDVRWAGHLLWKVALHPSRCSASFGQQTSGNQAVGWCNFPEDDVLRQNMVTVGDYNQYYFLDFHNTRYCM